MKGISETKRQTYAYVDGDYIQKSTLSLHNTTQRHKRISFKDSYIVPFENNSSFNAMVQTMERSEKRYKSRIFKEIGGKYPVNWIECEANRRDI